MPTNSYNIPIIPEITDADVDWIANILNLELDDERVLFLKDCSSIDVVACPGSGKTTLVIAKIAILVKKWTYKTKGICVLSHTNVAREEIEHRLLGIIGNRLFSYPHFIGTIHSFVNRFLTLPYLRSQGITNIIIDDALTYEFRKHYLGRSFFSLDRFLNRFHCSVFDLRLKNINYDISLLTKDFPAGKQTSSYKNAQNAVISSVKNGYFCFDEIFIFANALLDKSNEIHKAIAQRFPVIIIDEVQDTNRQQAFILKRIFFEQVLNVIQRVGDINQSIYNGMEETENCELNFPRPGYHTISKSFRFGQEIANLAHPLMVHNLSSDFIGAGPHLARSNSQAQNTIFIFPQSDTSKVLQSFGELVLDSFDDDLLNSTYRVMAIGGVHRTNPDTCKPHHFPKSISDYWGKYTPYIPYKKENFEYLIQYFIAGIQTLHLNNNFALAVDKIATGILRSAKQCGNQLKFTNHPHRLLTSYIANSQRGKDYLKQYNDMLLHILYNNVLGEDFWNTIKLLFDEMFTNVFTNKIYFTGNNNFFKFCPEACMHSDGQHKMNNPNICIIKKNDRELSIHLDSIHGVKGQTHLATLILDTFYNTHFFKRVFNFMITPKKVADLYQIKLAYVAMTRPTHLLCLAVADSSLGNNKILEKNKNTLSSIGWKFCYL